MLAGERMRVTRHIPPFPRATHNPGFRASCLNPRLSLPKRCRKREPNLWEGATRLADRFKVSVVGVAF